MCSMDGASLLSLLRAQTTRAALALLLPAAHPLTWRGDWRAVTQPEA